MRVELRRSGGFAATITARPVTVDTARMDTSDSDRVCRLVDGVRRCSSEADGHPGGADLIAYTLTITDDPDSDVDEESLRFSDPVPEAVDELVSVVLQLGEGTAP